MVLVKRLRLAYHAGSRQDEYNTENGNRRIVDIPHSIVFTEGGKVLDQCCCNGDETCNEMNLSK